MILLFVYFVLLQLLVTSLRNDSFLCCDEIAGGVLCLENFSCFEMVFQLFRPLKKG